MREVFRDCMIFVGVVFAGISAYYQSHPPTQTDPPVAQAIAEHPTSGLVLVAVLFIIAGVLNFAPLLLRFFPTRLKEKFTQPKSSDVEGYAASLLRNQAYEIAKLQLDQLSETAQFLVIKVPVEGTDQGALCTFWAQSVSKWRSDVIQLLKKTWGDNVVADFADAEGFNRYEPVGNVLHGAADSYRDLLHCQRNLKNIKRAI